MSFNITVEGGKSVRLPTAGKYCDRDIVVEAEGGTPTPTQEKTVNITANGTHTVTPDEGYALSKVTANVNVPIPEGYIQPSGTLSITANGTYDVKNYASINVSITENLDVELATQEAKIAELLALLDTKITVIENLDVELATQEAKIAELYALLDSKVAGS